VFAGVGGGAARWGRFRGGVGANVVVGVSEDAGALRAELWAGYHLDPGGTRGPGPYAGVGAALAAARGGAGGFLVVFVGVESRPAGGRGWFVEAGVGGGPRVVLGYRFSRRWT
jgi:hypothetical protein